MALSRVNRLTRHIKRVMHNARKNKTQFSPLEVKGLPRVYRGTTGNNDQSVPVNASKNGGVHLNGFESNGLKDQVSGHDDIVTHVYSAVNSRYVSFAKRGYFAKSFCHPAPMIPGVSDMKPAYVHEANIPLFHSDTGYVVPNLLLRVDHNAPAFTFAKREGEISGFDYVPAEDIQRSRQVSNYIVPAAIAGVVFAVPFVEPITIVTSGAIFCAASILLGNHYVGPLLENPIFKSRDFSFRCPTMNEIQHKEFIKIDSSMPTGFEAISYPVAKKLHPVMKEMETFFADTPNQFGYHLIIDCVLKDDTVDYRNTIALIQEVYYTMREAAFEAPFNIIKLSSLIHQALELQRSYNDFMMFFKHENDKNALSVEEMANINNKRKPTL